MYLEVGMTGTSPQGSSSILTLNLLYQYTSSAQRYKEDRHPVPRTEFREIMCFFSTKFQEM